MIRALKKLKVWTKKRMKKRKRDLLDGTSTRSTPPHCCSCSCSCPCCSSAPQFQPTAPPLPPWLDFEQHREVVSDPVPTTKPGVVFPPPVAEPSARWLPPTGNRSETTPLYALAPGGRIPSYQQYLVPDPVYGVPIARPAPDERASGPGACGGAVEAWFRRCFCCCLGNSN